jgi:hypothetical protein
LASDSRQAGTVARIGLSQAVRRHWITALIPVVLLVAAAVVLGLKRTPQFSATANLSVEVAFVSNPAALSNILAGTQSLAPVYSRTIHANAVREATARRLAGRFPATAGTVSATPIPESPIIKVTAVTESADHAVALANATSEALAEYVNSRPRSANETGRLAASYRRAALRYRRRLDVSRGRTETYTDHPTEANRQARDRAGAAAEAAMLRRDTLFMSYQNAVQGLRSRPRLVVFASAQSASSDRYVRLQILVVVALVGGGLAGAALAFLRAQRRTR